MPKGRNKQHRRRIIKTGERRLSKAPAITRIEIRSSEAPKDSLRKINKKSYKNPKKVIITDLIILAHKQRCTRDSRDCQREQKKKKAGGVVSCIRLAYARRIPHLCHLYPNPCNPLVLWQLHHSHTSQLQCSRKTKTPGCKRL